MAAPAGLVVRGDVLSCEESQTVDGMAVTTPAHTAFDLGRPLSVDHGVPRIDALMNAIITRHAGVRGVRALRETLRYVDGGAESPYESMTRLRLCRSGFPPSETQIQVFDDAGCLFARLDMG